MRLSYTYVRTADGRRVVIPNERLAQGTIENHTITDPRVRLEVSLWIPHEADAERALELLGEQEDVEVEVAEITPEGIRLTAGMWADSFEKRGPMEAGLRAGCLEKLQREGLSSKES